MRTWKNGSTWGWSHGDKGWGDSMNRNIELVSTLTNLCVKGTNYDTPIVANEGDAYLVPKNASTAWENKEGYVAVFFDNKWNFYKPFEGLSIYSKMEKRQLIFDGDSWLIGDAFNIYEPTLSE